METMREAEGVAVSLEQSRKRERVLEEEGKRLTEERADALRLLKELQEQIAAQAAAAPLQPVQYFPVGQSFSPQPSYASHSRPSTHSKRPPASTRAEQRKEEDVDERRTEITTSYPSDREPGEGIDSEHITASTDVESSQRGGRRRSNEAENNSRDEAMESETSAETKRQFAATVVTAEKTPEEAKASEELKRENAMLRSEMKDVREELQKRLDDLEAQRKAEAEARTRLKQLSRKHASKAAEKETQEREWKLQLENERAETERLRKALAALETTLKRRREDEGNQEIEKNKELEDRESEMTELNIQLKKQLAEVKAQLALEREERKREEEERNQITNTDIDEKNELNAQLAELKAELEELKHNRKDESLQEEHLLVTNSPLTYLTLRDDELNSNIVHCDNKLLPSPEQHLFCQSTNQFNVLVDLFREERTMIDPENSPLSDKGKTGQLTSDLDDTRQNYLEGSPLSGQTETLHPLEQSETDTSDLGKEVERLKKERAKATEQANQSRVKLEALQSQVTRQTRQLTMAFEKQSQHISGLLVELQEKESTLLSQGEELQRCKEELETFKAEKEAQEVEVVEESVKNTEEKLCVDDSAAQEDVDHPNTKTPDAVTPTSVSSDEDGEALLTEERCPSSVNSDQSENNHDSACVIEEIECSQDGDMADAVSKLLALQQENRLLKERIEGLTVTDASSLTLKTDCESQEEPVERCQNTGNAVLFCSTEQRPPSELSDLTAEGQESLPPTERSRKEDGGDVKREDEGTARDKEQSQLQIKHLEQQVVALQMKVQTLSAETQQQAEELTMWRLASQEPPTFDRDDQDQGSSVGQSQSNQQQTELARNQVQVQGQTPGIQERPNNVTIIREDNLLLSCFSNKLQSRILSSRLQYSDLPEPKSFHPPEKTAALQEHNQDTAEINMESEIKKHEINFLQLPDTCPTEHKENRDAELFQMSSEETGQQHVTKDLHRVSKPNKTETTECHTLNPEAGPDASSATNGMNHATNDSSGRAVRTEMRSVICQTEETLYPVTAPAASELHCASTQTEEERDVMDEDDLAASPSVSSVPHSERAESEDKLLLSGSFPIPTDPARLAERIRRNRTQLSAAFDDTEYEPYGLPEVVMKGFADIPTGPSCPYIVRRGLLGTTVVPAHQKAPGQEEETD